MPKATPNPNVGPSGNSAVVSGWSVLNKARKTGLSVAAMRIPTGSLLGVLIIVLATTFYSFEQTFMTFVTPERAGVFQSQADLYLLLLTLGSAIIAVSYVKRLRDGTRRIAGLDTVPLGLKSLVPFLLSQKRYVGILVASSLAYGLFYGVVTSVIVYQPSVDFADAYGAGIPSAVVTPCCGPPLMSPVVTVFLTAHLGLLLIPLTVFLLLAVSILVGLNVTISAFAFDNRTRKGGGRWLLGIGGAFGLFTGCPTCAGLFFAGMVGGPGAASLATALAFYQPLFVGITLPVLLAAPVFTARRLSRVFSEGCVVVRTSQAQSHREEMRQTLHD